MYPNSNNAKLQSSLSSAGMQGEMQAASCQPPAPSAQIHPQIADLGQRIASAAIRLDKVLARARGAQPVPAGQAEKNPSEPSTLEYLSACHQAMSYLECQIGDLEVVIG